MLTPNQGGLERQTTVGRLEVRVGKSGEFQRVWSWHEKRQEEGLGLLCAQYFVAFRVPLSFALSSLSRAGNLNRR